MYQFNSFNVVYLAKILHLTLRKIFLCHRNGGIQRRMLYNCKLQGCQDIFQFAHGFPVLGLHIAG